MFSTSLRTEVGSSKVSKPIKLSFIVFTFTKVCCKQIKVTSWLESRIFSHEASQSLEFLNWHSHLGVWILSTLFRQDFFLQMSIYAILLCQYWILPQSLDNNNNEWNHPAWITIHTFHGRMENIWLLVMVYRSSSLSLFKHGITFIKMLFQRAV